jgi:hypothetical protein
MWVAAGLPGLGEDLFDSTSARFPLILDAMPPASGPVRMLDSYASAERFAFAGRDGARHFLALFNLGEDTASFDIGQLLLDLCREGARRLVGRRDGKAVDAADPAALSAAGSLGPRCSAVLWLEG